MMEVGSEEQPVQPNHPASQSASPAGYRPCASKMKALVSTSHGSRTSTEIHYHEITNVSNLRVALACLMCLAFLTFYVCMCYACIFNMSSAQMLVRHVRRCWYVLCANVCMSYIQI